MIIGIDIDDVLADFMPALIQYHNDTYGTSLTKDHFRSGRLTFAGNWSDEEATEILQHFNNSSYFRGMQPIEGSQEASHKIVQDHKTYIITSRPELLAESTRDWINQHFPNKFSGLFFANGYHDVGNSLSKKDVCDQQGIDILIEDSKKYALECLTQERKIILMNQPWNEEPISYNGIKRVYSWQQVIDSIYQHS